MRGTNALLFPSLVFESNPEHGTTLPQCLVSLIRQSISLSLSLSISLSLTLSICLSVYRLYDNSISSSISISLFFRSTGEIHELSMPAASTHYERRTGLHDRRHMTMVWLVWSGMELLPKTSYRKCQQSLASLSWVLGAPGHRILQSFSLQLLGHATHHFSLLFFQPCDPQDIFDHSDDGVRFYATFH